MQRGKFSKEVSVDTKASSHKDYFFAKSPKVVSPKHIEVLAENTSKIAQQDREKIIEATKQQIQGLQQHGGTDKQRSSFIERQTSASYFFGSSSEARDKESSTVNLPTVQTKSDKGSAEIEAVKQNTKTLTPALDKIDVTLPHLRRTLYHGDKQTMSTETGSGDAFAFEVCSRFHCP